MVDGGCGYKCWGDVWVGGRIKWVVVEARIGTAHKISRREPHTRATGIRHRCGLGRAPGVVAALFQSEAPEDLKGEGRATKQLEGGWGMVGAK